MIELIAISKQYNKRQVLENLNLNIKSPGMYLITGASGVGKTTLFNIISGNDRDFKGQLKVDYDIAQVVVDLKLFENLSIYDNLKIVNKNGDIDYYLDLFKLKELKKVPVKYLSGGEKQRVALIRCLLMETPILLLDEITSSLDDDNAKLLLQVLQGLSQEKIIAIISHDQRFNEMYDEIYKLENNTLVLIKKKELIPKKLTNKKVNKALLLPAFKNTLYGFKKTAISYLMMSLILIFISFIGLYFIPIIIDNIEEISHNINTTTFTFDVNIYDENSSGYHQYYIDEIEKIEGFISFDSMHNISEFNQSDKVILHNMYMNYNYLTYYDQQNMQHLNEITDIVINPTYTNYMLEYDSIGTIPSNENEIAIGSDLALLYFNNPNMEEIIGKEITLSYIGQDLKIYEKNYTITGIYEVPYQELDNIYGEVNGNNTLFLNSVQLYNPTYTELDIEDQKQIEELIPMQDINDGYYSFSFTMKTKYVTQDLITDLENINPTDNIAVTTNDNTNMSKQVKEIFIIFISILVLGILLCIITSIISMRYRKNEYAKYYLCGCKTSNIISMIVIEYIIYAFICIPLIIAISTILYQYIINDIIYCDYKYTFILVTIIILLICIISAILVALISRKSKVLKNLKGVL